VAALTRGSPDDTVFVGAGDASTPHEGGYEAFGPDGSKAWYVAVKNPSTDLSAGKTSAVIASLAVGDLQGGTDVVAPSAGQEEYAINAATGSTLPGFPWFTSDSGFSTPALADLYGNGRTEVIEGGDQTAGLADGVQYTQGGHLRVIAPTGNKGTGSPTGGLDCEANPDVGVESSPAVGRFLAGGATGIVVGTGTTFRGSDTDKVLAYGTHCQLVWRAALGAETRSSPALADIEGHGSLAVLEGTYGGPGPGSVYALNGATGAVIWDHQVGDVFGGVATADLGEGYQDVIVASLDGAVVLDGRTGQVVASLEQGVASQNTPLVTADPNGTVGVTIAGYNGYNEGQVEHFELAGASGASVDEAGAWPMFHHDPQLSGTQPTGTQLRGNSALPGTSGTSGTAGKAGTPGTGAHRRVGRCTPPAGGPDGYYEVGSGGAVYAYGNLARCGALAGHKLAHPVVGIAAAPDGGGYWLVDRAGTVSAFGDVKGYGSRRGGKGEPIVGIAATPDGKGYWIAAANGTVSAFGDAKVYPSRGPAVKAKPTGEAETVGIASTADGHGYWLVAGDGAVRGFGDAVAHNSHAVHMSSVTGIAAAGAAGGYWLVDKWGAVYAFGSPFYGSVPAIVTERAVAGIAESPGGGGYRLVDGGGALFCFGTATHLGSASTAHPAQAIVGIASPGTW
jgi:hypothetical protein